MVAFVNNQFIDQDKATIGIADLSIHRGFGIFDFFRITNNVPLFIDDYFDRFFRSAKSLRLKIAYSRQEIKDIIAEMIRRNDLSESGFKMILTGGYSTDGFEPAEPNFIVIQYPVVLPDEQKFQKGLHIILHEYQRDLPETKSLNYLMSIYLLDKIRQQNADEVLYYKNNFILEFPRSNIFVVTPDKTIVTPSVNVLRGITRKKVLEVASKEYQVEERNVTVEELKSAAEVFLTSTTKRIIPVLTIEGKNVGNGLPGEIAKKLYEAFVEMEKSMYLDKAVAL